MSTPIGTATSAPTRSSHGLPAEKSSRPNTCPPPLANSTAAHAPTPTKVIWASEIWPDQPIKGTSESMMNAVTSASPTVRTSGREISPTSTKTVTRRTANPKSARV